MTPYRISVDGRELGARPGENLLELCLDNSIYIPHLCHHNALRPIGACRLCLVEIEGEEDLKTSCTAEVFDGMVVRTQSEAITRARLMAIELMLSGHQADCGTCVKYLNCELQSLKQYLIADDLRVKRRSRLFSVTESNPLFNHEPNKCVLCGRCVRACRELRGIGVLYYKYHHGEAYIGVGPDCERDIPLSEAGCRFCGACAEVCPTGAILDKDEFGKDMGRKEALLPCSNTCPAEIDVPRYLRFIREGNLAAAVAAMREKVPFPRTLGYVCGHPCEDVCRRGQVSEPVSICRLKRFAADNDTEHIWRTNLRAKEDSGKRAAVIGAGPAGLSAAYYLTLQGHSVTVYEAMPEAGGMLRYAIPEYRLPPGVLDMEIKDIEAAGVKIKTTAWIDSIDPLMKEGYDAVLIAVGTHEGVRLKIPGAKGDGVLACTDFLKSVRLREAVCPGNRVVVLGGGNVAIDCARVARRLGARDVVIVCLELREKMPASQEDIIAAEEEGIRVYPAKSCKRINRTDGIVTGAEFLNVTALSFNENNVPHVETEEGSEHVISADCVIFAVGQRPLLPDGFGVDKTDRGLIDADLNSMETGKDGVFAAADAVTGTDRVISAIAAGRKAARVIDKYLGGRGRIDQKLAPETELSPLIGTVDGFALQQRVPEKLEQPDIRVHSFCIVDQILDSKEAAYEAGRCLQCDLRLKMKQERFWSSY